MKSTRGTWRESGKPHSVLTIKPVAFPEKDMLNTLYVGREDGILFSRQNSLAQGPMFSALGTSPTTVKPMIKGTSRRDIISITPHPGFILTVPSFAVLRKGGGEKETNCVMLQKLVS